MNGVKYFLFFLTFNLAIIILNFTGIWGSDIQGTYDVVNLTGEILEKLTLILGSAVIGGFLAKFINVNPLTSAAIAGFAGFAGSVTKSTHDILYNFAYAVDGGQVGLVCMFELGYIGLVSMLLALAIYQMVVGSMKEYV